MKRSNDRTLGFSHSMPMYHNMGGFPPRLFVKLSANLGFTSGRTAANSVFVSVAGNQAQDPFLSFAAVSLKGWSDWNSIYRKYIIHKSKCTAQFFQYEADTTTTDGVMLYAVLCPTGPGVLGYDSQLPTDMLDLIGWPKDRNSDMQIKYKKLAATSIVTAGPVTTVVDPKEHQIVTLSMSKKTKMMCHENRLDRISYSNQGISSDSLASTQWLWNIGLIGLVNTDQIGTCNIRCTLTYWVEFWNPDWESF